MSTASFRRLPLLVFRRPLGCPVGGRARRPNGRLAGHPTDRRKAFTVLELLIVVGILALLSGFTIPTFQLLLAQVQLSTASSDMEELLRLTQQKTVTEQNIYGVTLIPGATTVPRFRYNPLDGTKTIQETYTLPSSIRLDTVNLVGETDIRFSTSGAPNVSGDVVLLDVDRTRRRRIDIRPSGAVFANQSEY
jgi:prepilin-type N-terminal cleavage/methylation domain-containing protein